MKFSRSTLLLPCHSLEDFPIHAEGNDADSLLANWTVAWHPRLILATETMPGWTRAELAEDWVNDLESAGKGLVLIPTLSQTLLPFGFVEYARGQGIGIIENELDRPSILDQINSQLSSSPESQETAPTKPLTCDDPWAAEFFALGYGFLQVQLLTRRLRGSSNLDESLFTERLVAAAQTTLDKTHDEILSAVAACFDLLLEEKNNYYPVQPELVDLILTAPTTLAEPLAEELRSNRHRQNLMITGADLQIVDAQHEATAAELKKKIAVERVSIVGGLQDELCDARMSSEATINQLQRGVAKTKSMLDVETSVFGRRTPGFSVEIPGILENFNFLGALHCRFTRVRFPRASVGNIRWESDDGRAVMALAQDPKDANSGNTFLRLGVSIGEEIDSAHLSTVLLAHWPQRTHFAMQDLKTLTEFAPLFGNFVHLSDFFDAVYDPGYGESFSANEYQSNDLNALVARDAPDPISRWGTYWKRSYRLSAIRSVALHVAAVEAERATEKPSDSTTDLTSVSSQNLFAQINDLQTKIELATEKRNDDLDSQLEQLLATVLSQLGLTPVSEARQGTRQGTSESPSNRLSVVNPVSFPRTIEIQSEGPLLNGAASEILIADSDGGQVASVIKLNSQECIEFEVGAQPARAAKKEPKLVEGTTIRNEFFAIEIDEQRGGILSLHPHNRRKTLVSQRLGLRIPAETDESGRPTTASRYAEMNCHQVEVRENTRVIGEVVTRGEILDGQTAVANFEQTFRLVRGRQVAEMEIFIEPRVELPKTPGSYFCSRFAWSEQALDLIYSARETRSPVSGEWIEAPNFIEVVDSKHQITLFPMGLPFHRRRSREKIDSILMVAGESQNRWRFGIGLNVPFALREAVSLMTPAILARPSEKHEASREVANHKWIFHLSSKNVIATWWQPVWNDVGKMVGLQIRMRETQGRAGRLKVYCRYRLDSAMLVKFCGDFIQDIPVTDNYATINLMANDFLQIQLSWNS